jgi:hypothetical protein
MPVFAIIMVGIFITSMPALTATLRSGCKRWTVFVGQDSFCGSGIKVLVKSRGPKITLSFSQPSLPRSGQDAHNESAEQFCGSGLKVGCLKCRW